MGLGCRTALGRAFALTPAAPLSDEDRALLDRLAAEILHRGMREPALLALDSLKPLSGLGGQALLALKPFLASTDWERAARLLERRQGLEGLVERLEAASATMPASRA